MLIFDILFSKQARRAVSISELSLTSPLPENLAWYSRALISSGRKNSLRITPKSFFSSKFRSKINFSSLEIPKFRFRLSYFEIPACSAFQFHFHNHPEGLIMLEGDLVNPLKKKHPKKTIWQFIILSHRCEKKKRP